MRHTPTAALKAWLAIFTLVVACVVPIVAGMAVALDPLVNHKVLEWVPVTRLGSLPAVGAPRRIPVKVPCSDAWTGLPDEIAGFVFLRRLEKSEEVLALRTTHGRTCCSVEFDTKAGTFSVPCRSDLRFDIDGRRISSNNPVEGDLKRLRSIVAGDAAYIRLSDLTATET